MYIIRAVKMAECPHLVLVSSPTTANRCAACGKLMSFPEWWTSLPSTEDGYDPATGNCSYGGERSEPPPKGTQEKT